MARTYEQIEDVAQQMLQDTAPATYDTTETRLAIEESLKEFAKYDPHIVPIIFKIESRTGTDVTGTANKLTDLVKLQFVDLAAETEKVVHNTTDNTWATIWDYYSTSVYNLSADIMDADENYEIYNKRCWNKKQIYIGDVTDYLWIDSVEYPIGTRRNWKVYRDVLEIDVDSVADSDSTLDPPSNIDVLVRFAKPHRLCQLDDLAGLVQSNAAALAKSLKVYGFKDTEVVDIGDEFTIEGHRQIYTVITSITLQNQSSTGITLTIYPGLEWAAIADRVVTFTISTLKPQHEEIFCHLIAARVLMSEANAQLIQAKSDLTTGRALVNTINKGGPGATVANAYIAYARAGEELAREQRSMGERKLAEVIGKMEALSPPRTKRSYPTD